MPRVAIRPSGVSVAELGYDPATQTELDAHALVKSGVHGIPALAGGDAGKGLLWDGSGWTTPDMATQAELDTHAALAAASAHGGLLPATYKPLEEIEMSGEGYKSWTFRPSLVIGSQTPTTQQAFYTAIPLRAGVSYTGLDISWSNTPSSLTLLKLAVYLVSDLSQKKATADVSAAANAYNGSTSGRFRTPFSGGTFTPGADALYYACVLCVGTGTFPQLARGAAASSLSIAAANGVRPWGFQASLSDLADPAVLASASSPVWFGAY
jgi:hypothetical protein